MGRQKPIFDYKGGECKDDFMIIMRNHFYYLKFCSFKYVLQCHAMQPEASIGGGYSLSIPIYRGGFRHFLREVKFRS